jgi:glycosyltransferase involved in cell wall biosynthesis
MRILIGCDTFDPDINGAASFTRRLAVALVERGHDVHVMAPAPDRWHGTRREVHDGVEMTVHRIYSWPWPPHPWFRYVLPWRSKAHGRRIIDLVRPDVVHFQSHIVIGRGLAIAAKKRGIRVIGTNHTMPENVVQHVTILPPFANRWLVRAQWRSARKIFSLAEAVTSPTRRSADYFEQMTGLSGVHAVSNGIDVDDYASDFSPRTENRIAYVGRLDEEKHIDELIAATARLDPDLDVHVDIVGGGEQREKLEKLAAARGVADRVQFHGKASDEVLRQVLIRGSVFAMPSRAELQCIAAMEAMASALPIVAANAMALPHLVRPGENGYLYEPGDIDGFAQHLTTVLTASPEVYEGMKRASQRIVAPHDLQRVIDVFEALYRGERIVDPTTEPASAPTEEATSPPVE